MLYCRDCQLLCEQECPQCGSRSLREPQANDPVLLGVFDFQDSMTVESLLIGTGIPFEKFGSLGAALTFYIGKRMENYRFFVPYSQHKRCAELLSVFLQNSNGLQQQDESD